MAAKKGSEFASRTQPNAPHLAENPHPQKPRVGHPLSAEERKLQKEIRKKNEKLRRKYRAVRGKVVDWVDHWIEEGWLFVSIRFQDQTDFYMQFGAKIVTEEIDLRDRSSGKLRLVRQYFSSRDA